MRVWGRLNRGPPWGPDPPGLRVPVLWGLFTALDKVSMSHTFEPTLFTHSGLHRRWSYGREGGGGGSLRLQAARPPDHTLGSSGLNQDTRRTSLKLNPPSRFDLPNPEYVKRVFNKTL